MKTLREMIAGISAANAAQAKPSAPFPIRNNREHRLAALARLIEIEISRLRSYARDYGLATTKATKYWAAGFSIDALIERVKQKGNPGEPAK